MVVVDSVAWRVDEALVVGSVVVCLIRVDGRRTDHDHHSVALEVNFLSCLITFCVQF